MLVDIRKTYTLKAAAINLIIVTVLLLILYQYRHGLGMLNPVNDGWLMKHDWATHYLGWFFFRNEPWSFPIGNIANYLYPVGTNVGFTDSIPLASIFFKIFSPILPHNFQFIGPWLFMCHVLLAFFLIKLFDLFSVRGIPQLIGTLIVVFNPVLLHRAIHPALCSHWLIIGGLWVYFLDPNKYSPMRLLTYQGIFMIVGALINPYFFLIGGGFFLALVWRLWQFDRTLSFWRALLISAGIFVVLLISWYVVGFFSFQNQNDLGVSGAYGLYAYNLNSLYNSGGWSAIHPGFPLVSWHQYESFMYLGAGMIGLLLLMGLLATIKFTRNKIRGLKEEPLMGEITVSLLPLVLFVILISLFAITNVITLNDRVLWTIALPNKLQKLVDVFRASARYFWIVYYLILIFIIVLTVRILKHRIIVSILLMVVFAIQLYDYKLLLGTEYIANYQPYHPPISEVSWRKIFNKMDRFIFYPAFQSDYLTPTDYRYFCYLAADYQKPINLGYAARLDNKAVGDYVEELRMSIDQGALDKNTLYITTPEYAGRFMVAYQSGLLAVGQLDGYYFFYPGEMQSDPAFSGLVNNVPETLKERQIFKPFSLAGSDQEIEWPMQVERLERSTHNIFLKGFILKSSSMDMGPLSILLTSGNNAFISSPIPMAADSILVPNDSLKFNMTYFTDGLPPGNYRIAAYASSSDAKSKAGTYGYFGNINIGLPDFFQPQERTDVPQLHVWLDAIEDSQDKLKLIGWAFVQGQSSYANRIEILLRSDDKLYSSPTDPMLRPDVTSYFNSQKNLETCGFVSFITKKELKKGTYEVGIRIINDKTHEVAIEYTGRRLTVK